MADPGLPPLIFIGQSRPANLRAHLKQGPHERLLWVVPPGPIAGALLELDRRGATITFAVVAARASVSRQLLYSHPDLRADIERLRGQQRAPARLPVRERASDESIRARLRAALDENKRLRDEIAALREELELAHGRARELELATRAGSAR